LCPDNLDRRQLLHAHRSFAAGGAFIPALQMLHEEKAHNQGSRERTDNPAKQSTCRRRITGRDGNMPVFIARPAVAMRRSFNLGFLVESIESGIRLPDVQH
jgi:hypothetical protein